MALSITYQETGIYWRRIHVMPIVDGMNVSYGSSKILLVILDF